ncbi:uncharacterized protein DFL_006891 [Arthrobotrys flagrans]|uniref:PAC domain-containing protein n=1 Tax=Arthrobotrys flagrans TaxID=97331 RepID=A0A436ZUN0_ARTFL|nr:hypothetical protein DFL_006891 [Arthrobotrys flagrans]
MDLLRRISGSSTNSSGDNPFRRSLSLGPLRRKSSKDSSKAIKIRKALKDHQHLTYTSAPQSPLVKSRTGSFPELPELEGEDIPSAPRPIRPPNERMYSHANHSTSNHSDENDLPLGVVFAGLSPRRESTLSIPFTLPRLTKDRRISEHIDPMHLGVGCMNAIGSMSTMSLANSASIPRSMTRSRRKSEAVSYFDDMEEEEEEEEVVVVVVENGGVVQKEEPKRDERFDKTVPHVSVLPDVPEIQSASSSYSARNFEARGSVVSFATTNSSAPSPTNNPTSSMSKRKILPYIPDDESYSYDLLPPTPNLPTRQEKLAVEQIEELSQKIYSKDHLRIITSDPRLLHSFSQFLASYRPSASMDLLTYYLDAKKAIKAINYANALAESLGPSPSPDRSWIHIEDEGITPVNKVLERKAADAFKILTEQELPRYVSWVYTEIVTYNIQKKITGGGIRYLEESANELGEVFCLTDPQRHGNPIVFASEEFHRTTQYPISYVSGRNCRFLQGPKTQRHSIARLRDAIRQGREITECFLNYKRDGTPFLNLVMVAPLLDSKGQVRYFIGAQIDVTTLAKNFVGLEGLGRLMTKQKRQSEVLDADLDLNLVRPKHEEFKQLADLFSAEEMEKVKETGGQLHKDHKIQDPLDELFAEDQSVERDSTIEPFFPPGSFDAASEQEVPKKKPKATKTVNFWSSTLKGVYRNYILVRPYPSLRILFASPSMRTPGILQSPLMSKIGGSDHVREELESALSDSRGITIKVRWLSKLEEQNPNKSEFLGRERWLHCTPLFDANGTVGVWMIVVVDDDSNPETISHHEYDISDLDLGLERRPISSSTESYRLSTPIDTSKLIRSG